MINLLCLFRAGSGRRALSTAPCFSLCLGRLITWAHNKEVVRRHCCQQPATADNNPPFWAVLSHVCLRRFWLYSLRNWRCHQVVHGVACDGKV